VVSDEPPVGQVTDTQLQAALERQTAGQTRLQSDLEQSAAAAAWQRIEPSLTKEGTWTDIEPRAAVALLIDQHENWDEPVPVKVITTWSGTDPDGMTGVHRAQTKLLYHPASHRWRALT
jgi:hypothetical protein